MSKHSPKLNTGKSTSSEEVIFGTDHKGLVSIAECRKILNDYQSPDRIIEERLKYLTALCRNLIRHEIKTGKKYEQSKKD